MASRLQQELKKRGPFQSLEQEVILNIARTGDQLLVRAERLLREHGLTASQYNILRILRGEGKPLPMQEIASRTVQVVPGITASAAGPQGGGGYRINVTVAAAVPGLLALASDRRSRRHGAGKRSGRGFVRLLLCR